jgi:gamma-butyrobetaine dioxygenase
MTQSVRLSDKGLYVPLSRGETYFNYHWLRDACPSAIDPQTRERVFDISSLENGPHARAAQIEDDTLVIDWANEDHQTRLPLAQLQDFVDHGRKPDPADLPRRLWYSDGYDGFRRVRQADAVYTDAGRAALARALVEDGVALVTDMENSDESLTRLVDCLGPVTPSAEGDHFEVRLEIAPTNLAFTAGPLEMHTDLPGEETAPGVQFLHCRENTVEGGRSLFLDGAAVAEALREEDPAAFDLLASHDIPFFYRHDGWDSITAEGFERSQFSVYARFVNGKEAFATRVNRIERHLPDAGDVQILNFTDRQYRDIVHLSDQGRRKARENPQQLVMF